MSWADRKTVIQELIWSRAVPGTNVDDEWLVRREMLRSSSKRICEAHHHLFRILVSRRSFGEVLHCFSVKVEDGGISGKRASKQLDASMANSQLGDGVQLLGSSGGAYSSEVFGRCHCMRRFGETCFPIAAV